MTNQKDTQPTPQTKPASTDFKNLHKKFVELGRQRNKLLNEMLAILPEIHKSGIWKKHASSIVEYAGKFGGIPKSAVLKRLRLEKHLEDKPALKDAIRTAGVHKVDMIARLATPKTDTAFADKVNNMSKIAVETLSKELRGHNNTLLGELPLPCKAVPVRIKLELDEKMSFLFMKLKAKWGVGNMEVMKLLIDGAVASEFAEKIVSLKAMRTQTAKKVKLVTGDKIARSASPRKSENVKRARVFSGSDVKPSRYINAYQKRAVLSRTGGKCAYNNCNKPAEHFHHTDRFMHSKNHQSLKPLCKAHHEFSHNGLIANENCDAVAAMGTVRAKRMNCELKLPVAPSGFADLLYRKYRTEGVS